MGGRRRFLVGALVAAAAMLSAAPSAQATFHEILVREVYAGGASNDSYVVLQAYSAGQNLLAGTPSPRTGRPGRRSGPSPSRDPSATARTR